VAQAEGGAKAATLVPVWPEPAARQHERPDDDGRANEEHLGTRRRHVEGERPERRHEAQPVDGDERQELAGYDEYQSVQPGAQAFDVGATSPTVPRGAGGLPEAEELLSRSGRRWRND
jgi:hypothetical protein